MTPGGPLSTAGGLVTRTNPLLVPPDAATEAVNVMLDEGSADEVGGLRPLASRRARRGALRFAPFRPRATVSDHSRRRDGWAWAANGRVGGTVRMIECHLRFEHPFITPEGQAAGSDLQRHPPTGRYTDSAFVARKGGEHHFFAAVSCGGRATEVPWWSLGAGVVAPEGLVGGADETVRPVLVWWDDVEKRVRVAAGDAALMPGRTHHIAVRFSGTPRFFVDGSAVNTVSSYGLSTVPSSMSANGPIYFGRGATRTELLKYDAQFDRKHVFAGRLDAVPAAVGATTVRFDGQQLAYASATANAYVGWRVRVASRTPSDDAEVGKVYRVTAVANQTTDAGAGSITLTLHAAHAITTSHRLDVVPPAEPVSVAASVQEVRLWTTAPTETQVLRWSRRKLFTDWRSPLGEMRLFRDTDSSGQPAASLLAYWPLDDDGGVAAKAIAGMGDAAFAPGPGGVSGDLALDGEQSALQIDLRKDPNFARNWTTSLGRAGQGSHEWNVCVRLRFLIPSDMHATSSGNLQDHLYQTLFSLGAEGASPRLEFRLTNFGANGLHVYVARPDGGFTSIPYTLSPGRWYDAVFGIEAVRTNASDPQEHFGYFVHREAPDGSAAQLRGAASSAFSLARTALQSASEWVASFGASVYGDASKGAQRGCAAALRVARAGVGFFRAHHPASGAPDVDDPAQLSPLARFDDEQHVDLGTCSLTPGSNVLTLQGGGAPSWLAGAFVVAESVRLVRKRIGWEHAETADAFRVDSVSGSALRCHRAHDGDAVSGATLRAVPWAAFADFRFPDGLEDADVGAVREPGHRWARSPGFCANTAPTLLEWSWAADGAYDDVPPRAVAPEWGYGVVDDPAAAVRAAREYVDRNGERRVVGVVGGSLFQFDDRFRQGHPHTQGGRCVAFPPSPRWYAERFGSETEKAPTDPRRVAQASSGIMVRGQWSHGNPDSAYGYLVQFRSRDPRFGRQTLLWSGGTDQAHPSTYQVGIWARLEHGKLVAEVRLDSGWMVLATARDDWFRAGEWHEVLVKVQVDSGGMLSAITLAIDGVDTGDVSSTTGTPDPADISSVAPLWIGCACPAGLDDFETGYGFDPLLGEVAACAYLSETDRWGGELDYLPGPVSERTSVWAFDFAAARTHDVVPVVGVDTLTAEIAAEPIPLGHGMGARADVVPSIEPFAGRVYVSTGASRPWRFDENERFTLAGIREPSQPPASFELERKPGRARRADADLPASVGRSNRCNVSGAAPNLVTFVGAAPTPSTADVGALVYVPSDPDMGAAGDSPPGYIAVVGAVTSTGFTTLPAPYTEQQIVGAGECAWTLFRGGKDADNFLFLRALQRLASTTPWGQGRLLCDGKDDNSAPQTEALAEGPTNEGCAVFRGSTYLETPAWQLPTPVARGVVLDFKAYVWPDRLPGHGEEMVLFERASDEGTGAYRIVVFEHGRLRFEFYDSALGAKRSIQTVGRVLFARQWFYVRLRYRWKQRGAWRFDSAGGWEPDLRWTRRAGTIDAAVNNFRDGLWVYACEGLHRRDRSGGYLHQDAASDYYGDTEDPAECALLTLPGCESSAGSTVAAGSAATHNHSQHLLNVGLLRSAPFITPQEGDSLFPTAGVHASSPRNGITATLAVNTIGALLSAGTPNVGSGVGACQWTMPAGFVLPRTCSMNRDDAWNRQARAGTIEFASQVQLKSSGTLRQSYWNDTHPAYPATDVGRTPNLAAAAVGSPGQTYGSRSYWGVLLRVWTMVTNGGGAGAPGSFPDGASAGVPRVLVIVHLNETDLGASSRGGTAGHRVFVTDDPQFGGDGLGSLKIGAVACAAGSTWHITIELPNGSNQAATSQNRNVCPSLLEHGPNPVGVNDSPDASVAPIRVGGTRTQGEAGSVVSGFEGRIDDLGFLVAALSTSSSNVYTPDCLPPDAFFTGPKDTRFQSLPRLAFSHDAAALDVASGSTASLATAVFRFDEAAGVSYGRDSGAAAEAPPLVVRRTGYNAPTRGSRVARVTFYDPLQDVESNPGPPLRVPADDDAERLDGEATFKIAGLPVSSDRRGSIVRRVYLSLPGGEALFRAAEVADNTTAAVTLGDLSALAAARPLSFDRFRPPVCRAMRAGDEAMAYAGLDDAPDVVVLSEAFAPEHVRGNEIVTCESGRGGPVRSLGLLRGLFVAGKKHALFVVNPSSPPTVDRVGGSLGCSSHASVAEHAGSLLMAGPLGVVAYNGNQLAHEASAAIARTWRDGLDPAALEVAAAAAWTDRDSYMVAVRRLGEPEARLVLAAEARSDQFGNRVWAWSSLDVPGGVSALAPIEVDGDGALGCALANGLGRIGSLDEGSGGFVTEAMPSVMATWSVGASGDRFVSLAFAGATRVFGPRAFEGVPLLFVEELNDAGTPVSVGTGTRFAVRLATHVVTHDPSVAWLPAALRFVLRDSVATLPVGATAVLGGRAWSWASPRIDAGDPSAFKGWKHLDLQFAPVVGGWMFVELMLGQDDRPSLYRRVPMDRGSFSLTFANKISRTIRFRVSGYGRSVGTQFFAYQVRHAPVVTAPVEPRP